MVNISSQFVESHTGKDTIVFLHGLYSCGTSLMGIKPFLQSNFNLMFVDLPNHGGSDSMEEFTPLAIAKSLVSTIKEVGSPVILLGHALGGKVAIEFANHFPEFVKELIIVDSTANRIDMFVLNHLVVLDMMKEVNVKRFKNLSDAVTFINSKSVTGPLSSLICKRLVFKEKLKAWQWDFDPEVLSRNIENMSRENVIKTKIEVPTLVIDAADSCFIDLHSNVDLLHKHFKNITSITLPQTNYLLPYRDPIALACAVIEWHEYTQKDFPKVEMD